MFHEEHEEKEKQREAADQDSPFNTGGPVKPPGVGNVIMGHTADDDYETLVPHADVNKDRDGEKPGYAGTNPLEEKQQRNQAVTHYHDPEFDTVVSKGSPAEGLQFDRVVAVPGQKEVQTDDLELHDYFEPHSPTRCGHWEKRGDSQINAVGRWKNRAGI